MPFKSEAQRAKFYAMKEEGKMSQETIDKWEAETPKNKKLPKRLGRKKSVDPWAALRAHTGKMKDYA